MKKYICRQNSLSVEISKYNFIIEKQLPRLTMKYTKCLSYPFPFYETEIINPFLNSRVPAYHDKVQGLSAMQ